jgi:hypothetical protein
MPRQASVDRSSSPKIRHLGPAKRVSAGLHFIARKFLPECEKEFLIKDEEGACLGQRRIVAAPANGA